MRKKYLSYDTLGWQPKPTALSLARPHPPHPPARLDPGCGLLAVPPGSPEASVRRPPAHCAMRVGGGGLQGCALTSEDPDSDTMGSEFTHFFAGAFARMQTGMSE